MDYSNYIEFTNLKSPASSEIKHIIKFANEQNYYGVCLNPGDLSVAAKYKKPELKLITVVGFPPIYAYSFYEKPTNPLLLNLGLYNRNMIKKLNYVIESNLADEIDLVLPMLWFVKGDFVRIQRFLSGIKKRYNKPIKVICELGTMFNDRVALYEIYRLLIDSNVDYFKTNTGLLKQDFNKLVVAIQNLNLVVQDFGLPRLKLKVSGGVRTIEQVETLVKLGADRIGTSAKLEFLKS
jgi:deoxyribose-phosphate aldolase